MPIAVACTCGAKLKAPDAAAGKRVKCPKCGSPLLVPAPAPDADFEMVDDDPPPAPAPARKKPRLLDDDLPTTKKVPAAPKSRPKAADDAEGDADDAPKRKPKPGRDADDDADDDRPKKKGKGKKKEPPKGKLPLVLGIVGGVLGLGVIVTIVVIVAGGGGGGSAKGTVPTQPAVPPPPPLPAGWSVFKGEGFSVAVPDAAQFKLQEQPPNVGGPGPRPPAGGKNYTNGAPLQPGQPINIYLVGITPVPAEAKAAFDRSPQEGWEAMRNAGGGQALQDEKTIQAGGSEGRQFTLKAGPVNGVVRVVVRGDKVYTWGLMGSAVPAEDGPDLKPFFDTFKFE